MSEERSVKTSLLEILGQETRYSESENKRRDSEDENDNKAPLRHNMNTDQMPKEVETTDTSKLVIKRKGGTKL